MQSVLVRAARAVVKSETSIEANLAVRKSLFREGRYVFLACMPKSGSTFLGRAICEITGYKYANLSYAYEGNEQELYLPKLVDGYGRSIVVHQHVRATGPNVALFNRLGIRPVVQVRNLFDVMVSVRDHLCQKGTAFQPSLYATDHFLSLREHEQFDFLITFAAPWYFNFFVSWCDATRDRQIQALWVKYEELADDWVAGVERVLAFHDLATPRDEIAAAVTKLKSDPQRVRLNKGVAGRGTTLLTAKQKARLVEMTTFYPWVDFEPIGLG